MLKGKSKKIGFMVNLVSGCRSDGYGLGRNHFTDHATRGICGHRYHRIYPDGCSSRCLEFSKQCIRRRVGAGNENTQPTKNQMQTRAELYDFLDYHAYEGKLDELFSKDQKE